MKTQIFFIFQTSRRSVRVLDSSPLRGTSWACPRPLGVLAKARRDGPAAALGPRRTLRGLLGPKRAPERLWDVAVGSRQAPRAKPPSPTLLQSRQTQSHFSVLSQNPSAPRASRLLIIHIKATFNNTLLTLTNFKGQVITWVSAGSCGFKGARKASPFAAKKVVEIFMKKSNDYFFRCDQIKIYVCGVGPGRENAIRGFASIAKTIQQEKGMNKAISKFSNKIVLIREMTKIPHNGCRPTKKRRI